MPPSFLGLTGSGCPRGRCDDGDAVLRKITAPRPICDGLVPGRAGWVCRVAEHFLPAARHVPGGRRR